MSFIDVEESRVRNSAADQPVVVHEEPREAAVVGVWGVSRWVACWKANEVAMMI
jgi:hypothetical protein